MRILPIERSIDPGSRVDAGGVERPPEVRDVLVDVP
jgi:hypothetical protein